MKWIKVFGFAAIGSVIFFACKKDTVTPSPLSYEYFPVERGMYVVYNVDSVYHADNDNNTDDSIYSWHFHVKEVIDSSFIDGLQRAVQVIRRYKRNSDTLPWEIFNTWTQVINSFSAYRTEDNIPYHKLSFPINDQQWNGNDANSLGEELYEYENYHVPYSINSLSFDSTLSVFKGDPDNYDNYVERIYGREIYANHVGMIFKERDDLHKINGLIVKGTVYRMSLVAYGKE